MIRVKYIEDEDANYRYEATLNDYDFQQIMDGFTTNLDNYFATYGRTESSARNKMIKEIKKVRKITKRFNEAEIK